MGVDGPTHRAADARPIRNGRRSTRLIINFKIFTILKDIGCLIRLRPLQCWDFVFFCHQKPDPSTLENAIGCKPILKLIMSGGVRRFVAKTLSSKTDCMRRVRRSRGRLRHVFGSSYALKHFRPGVPETRPKRARGAPCAAERRVSRRKRPVSESETPRRRHAENQWTRDCSVQGSQARAHRAAAQAAGGGAGRSYGEDVPARGAC